MHRPAISRLSGYLQEQANLLRIPTLRPETQVLVANLVALKNPKHYFEFGSGIGQSALIPFLYSDLSRLERVTLTERRADCCTVFERAPWPDDWRCRIQFIARDFWEWSDSIELNNLYCKIDFLLVDGEKAQYWNVIQRLVPYLASGAVVFIDNTQFVSSRRAMRGSGGGSGSYARQWQKNLLFHEQIKRQEIFRIFTYPSIDEGAIVLIKY